jgi:hypothetical protein
VFYPLRPPSAYLGRFPPGEATSNRKSSHLGEDSFAAQRKNAFWPPINGRDSKMRFETPGDRRGSPGIAGGRGRPRQPSRLGTNSDVFPPRSKRRSHLVHWSIGPLVSECRPHGRGSCPCPCVSRELLQTSSPPLRLSLRPASERGLRPIARPASDASDPAAASRSPVLRCSGAPVLRGSLTPASSPTAAVTLSNVRN